MLPLLHLVKWRKEFGVTTSSSSGRTHSALVDASQIHVRNVFLFGFGLALARQIFGEPIHCQLDGQKIDQRIVDTKCLYNGTRSEFEGEALPLDFYPWIPVVLLLTALGFHLPSRLWLEWTGPFLAELREDGTLAYRSGGDRMFWKTWALEVAYAVHLLTQFHLLDSMFHGVWSRSGWNLSALDVLFPEDARCDYHYVSGGIETWAKFRCLMPLNNMYRREFYVVYHLLAALLGLHVACLAWRVTTVLWVGISKVDVWWCTGLAAGGAKTWAERRRLRGVEDAEEDRGEEEVEMVKEVVVKKE